MSEKEPDVESWNQALDAAMGECTNLRNAWRHISDSEHQGAVVAIDELIGRIGRLKRA